MIIEKLPVFVQKRMIDWAMKLVIDFIGTRKKSSHKKGLHDLLRALRLKRIRLELKGKKNG